jgi:hypothetical protein
MQYIRTIEVCSSIKKDEILSFMATWVKHDIIMVSEISQAQKDDGHQPYSCLEYKKS